MQVYQLSEAAEQHYRGAGYALAAVDLKTREVVAFVYEDQGFDGRSWVHTRSYHRAADSLKGLGYVCRGMLSGRTFTEFF